MSNLTQIDKYKEVRRLAKEKGLRYQLSNSDNNNLGFQELVKVSDNTLVKDNLNDDTAYIYLTNLK
ncbi:Hypothetical protein DAL_147 [Psychrobacter phage D'Alembert]|nr:Hypothetical protein DAL_4 [Psychrobacter phage D'Alembert]CAH1193538.1 Hypothetical protein DAL_147 [Psychrobacter phage D'Alembert]